MRKALFVFIGILLVISCSDKGRILNRFESIKKQARVQFAPDKSIALAEFNLQRHNGHWVLNGETTVKQAHEFVVRKLDSLLSGAFVDSSIVLPDPALGDSTFGLVKVSTANIRREPRHAAELIDQSITGNVLKLLKRKGSWYFIQTDYGYLGWMTKTSFTRTDSAGVKQWQKGPLLRFTVPVDRIFTQPSSEAVPVCDAVLNSIVKKIKRQGRWTLVQLPDGRKGYVLTKHLAPVVVKNPKEVKAEQVLDVAYQLMGIPYLWGGNSAKGCDCSGFVQTVFKANGIQLPRDARQQALEGEEIIPVKDFSNVEPGDLLFFGKGKRITHVGLSLGGYRFIHQDSEVRLSSFNELDSDYSAYRKHTLKKIKRLLAR